MASTTNQLLNQAHNFHDNIVKNIIDLVNIETHSYDQPALDRGLDFVVALAHQLLGTPDAQNIYRSETTGNTALLFYRGTTPGSILLVGHYDTVWPTGSLEQWGERAFVTEEGLEALSGPGIFDMKTGLVEAIWSLHLARMLDQPLPDVHFIFNGDEELGSPFSRQIIEDVANQCDAALVFEATQEGKVKTARKGVGLITVTATGIEAHAGLEPDKGASAIHALTEWCVGATQLADSAAGTTINVGLINGGSGSNVVAGHANAVLDIRLSSSAELQRLDKELDEIGWSDQRVNIDVNKDWNRPPMEFTDASRQLFALMNDAAEELGAPLETTAVGGASDANFISALGKPVLCGIGAHGAGAHARHEHIIADAIDTSVALAAATILKIPAISR